MHRIVARLQQWPLKLVLKWVVFAALAVAGFYALRFALFILLVAYMLHGRDLMDASAKNARGDIASAETNFSEDPDQRSTTVVRLQRAGHWFSTTLVEARSWGVLVGLKWQDDDTLDLRLDFGCEPAIDPPVTHVGPIHIIYHWGDPGYVPKGGYESFRRRDLSPEPCPATSEDTRSRDAARRAFMGSTLIPTP